MIDTSKINLGTLDTENLEKVKMMLDINKIQQDIAESQTRSRHFDIEMEKLRQSIAESQATVEKMRKETQWFPWLQIITTLTTGILTGGLMVFLLTQLTK